MKMARVGDLAEQIRGVTFAKGDSAPAAQAGYLPILRAGNIGDGQLTFDDLVYVPEPNVKPRQKLLTNDVVIAASSGSLRVVGKAAQSDRNFDGAFGAFLKVLRPGPEVDPRYFAHFFQTPSYRANISSLAAGANINNLKSEHLNNLELPLPPLDEQRRIAAILDEADAIRQKRRQAIAHLDTLTQSIFNEMFGEEERANFELREICTLRSGGTPSKRENGFWNGDIPWFSLKDLKHDRLTDSIDHVTERSIQQTTLRTIAKDTILVGVRGMILAHTVPISLLKVDGTINQDVKALEVTESFTPEFLHAAMKGNHSYLLSQVTTAAHGTKRLESNALLSARIPCATSAEQIDFTSKIAHWAAARDRIKQLASGGDQLFASVQSRAFRGEL